LVEKAIATGDDTARDLDLLATVLTHCDDAARALPFYERAAALAPRDRHLLYNLATAQRMTGLLQQAERTIDSVIELQPDDYEAYYLRSDLRRQTRDANHVEAMQRRLAPLSVRDSQRQVPLYFALAKELDDLADYEQAFKYLQLGNHLRRRVIDYDVNKDIATIDLIIAQHHREALLAGAPGFDTEEPIFVVGLPRSGTTLLERILGGHSDILAAGELNAFPATVVNAVKSRFHEQLPKEIFVGRCLQISAASLGRSYLEATRPQTGRSARFVDKTPLNYLYLGLIARALPGAKVIALERDPADSCFAIYRTLFSDAYPFSYDFEEIGKYYCAWSRLMSHWREVLGSNLLTVRYEQLVQNPEHTSRQVLQFCGLDWQRSCLDFHNSPGSVATASASQVRRPIYATSVGLWRRYEHHLTPLTDCLRREGLM
jgi:tetratricopeptide (TPR) repeat protein